MTDDTARFLDDLDVLLGQERYSWAWPQLRAIAARVRQFGFVTDAQRASLAAAKAGGLDLCRPAPRASLKPTRRYEEYSGMNY